MDIPASGASRRSHEKLTINGVWEILSPGPLPNPEAVFSKKKPPGPNSHPSLWLQLRMLRRIVIGLLLAILSFAQERPAQKKPVTIDAVVNAPQSSLGAITWAPDGEHFIVTERGKLSLYDVRSGKERDIIALEKLRARRRQTSRSRGVFDWTNRRVGEHDVQWFADGKRLLVAAVRRSLHSRHR